MLRTLVSLFLLATSLSAQWTTSRISGSPEAPRPYIAEPVFTGITLSNGLEMIAMPGAGRFVAIENGGKIYSFPDKPDTKEQHLLIDLKAKHPTLSHAYGIAFHPKWQQNGFVFITYTLGDKLEDGTKLSRFKLAQNNPPVIAPDSEVVLLTWLCGGHNGASLQFGPDGMLYCSTGDAEVPSPPDPRNTGQGLDDLLSCILRLDVDREQNGKSYAIPADNPFVKTAGAKPEIYAFGFRNPWKISFDNKGRLWCGDVGWELWEMIHLVQKGGNHGWSAMEASQPIKPETQGPGEIIPPIAAHPHTEAASITGGYVYQGSRFPELRGAYLYGDYETGKIWALWHNGKQVTRREEIADSQHRIVTFGLSDDGEVYWMDYQKETSLFRLKRNPAIGNPSHFPRKLSETGLFSQTASQKPAPGVLPFEIAEPMWQDGATASRYIAIPDGKTIETQISGTAPNLKYTVKWPTGAVLARTVSLKQKLVETQLLHYDGESWNGYSYRWNEAQSDADLVGADGAEFTIENQPWRIHGRGECVRCHNNWSGFTLGFQPDQLLTMDAKPAATVADAKFMSRLPNRLVSSRDEKADIESRARSWLHANCAHCHRRHAGGSVQLMLNADLSTDQTMMLNEKPVRGDLGLTDARVIHPGKPHQSVLIARISRAGAGHMPMIGAREVDDHGFRLLWDWIANGEKHPSPSTLQNPSDALLALNSGDHHLDHANHSDPEIAGYFERFIPLAQRKKTLGTHFDAKKLLSVKGDAQRGSDLLSINGKMAICSSCHLISGSGKDFGPDLSQVGSRLTPQQLLESLHQPSKTLTKGYETWSITLQDGSIQTGFLVNSPQSKNLTLKLPTGQSIPLPASQIQSQKRLPTSLMPEGLLQALTEQEAADILAFLTQLKAP